MRYHYRPIFITARLTAFEEVINRMNGNYGMSSDEWCKDIYDFVVKQAEFDKKIKTRISDESKAE